VRNKQTGMTPIFEILSKSPGAEVIRQCWGEMPLFDGLCEVLHLAQSSCGKGVGEILVTALFVTTEAEALKECKPSKIRILFSGVTHFEYDNGRPEKNDIKLADVFKNPPPPGINTTDFGFDHFHVAYSAVQILSCVHDPFTQLDDDTT
jgi:hypothetical protein